MDEALNFPSAYYTKDDAGIYFPSDKRMQKGFFTMLYCLKAGLIIAVALLTSFYAQASGGVALGATRVIYPADAKQTSLAITNSDPSTRYLVNAWIDDRGGKKSASFIVTPPLFVSEAKSENTLRIVYAGQPLPADRESLFWMNVKAIPSVDKNALEGKNVLQLAILSRIKLFVRPQHLPTAPEDAPGQLRFARSGEQLEIANPSPYFITLVNVRVGGQKMENIMVAPKESAQLALSGNARGDVTFQTVNDYGAVTPVRTVSLH